MNISEILIVEDDLDVQELIKYNLENVDALITTAETANSALEKINDNTNVVILDVNLPDASGIDLLSSIKAINNNLEVIMLSSNSGDEFVINSIKNGAFWYLNKPCEKHELKSLVSKALESSKLKKNQDELKEAISLPIKENPIIGNSKLMLEVKEKTKKIVKISTNIFIGGESGTGKTTLAKHIHNLSDRKNSPFIVVSCAAIPNDLLEAELFGHEKGAFTGAHKARPGRIEMADTGTLFLDEIGELPLKLQSKLLNFIQDREIRRLGASETKKVDVRIISATHKNLEDLCKQKLFREDLFYRLFVININLPALREREDDIILLTQSILERIALVRNQKPKKLKSCAKSALLNYEWPGNIRELENVLERVTTFIDSDSIKEVDLNLANNLKNDIENTKDSLIEVEKKYVKLVLDENNWNKAKSSRILGLSERGLYNKINRFKLKPNNN